MRFHPKKSRELLENFTKTVILLGLAGYELIITNSAYGLVGYYQLLSGKSEKNDCFSKLDNYLDFFG